MKIASKSKKSAKKRKFKIYKFQRFAYNFRFLPWLQIFNMVFLTYLLAQLTLFPTIFEIHKVTGSPKGTKVRSVNFVVFVTFFGKNGQLQLRFSPWRKKIFDFSGKFSESSNDFLSQESRPTGAYLNAYWCKIASKHRGFKKSR